MIILVKIIHEIMKIHLRTLEMKKPKKYIYKNNEKKIDDSISWNNSWNNENI